LLPKLKSGIKVKIININTKIDADKNEYELNISRNIEMMTWLNIGTGTVKQVFKTSKNIKTLKYESKH
jgi:hypothetical protein